MSQPIFEIGACDATTAARTGRLALAHGVVETPVFMPVGTQATVKSVHPRELEELGAQVILNNTYHLNIRPGMEVMREFGSVHAFQHWNRPILTDSGGFQVFSLSGLRKIGEEGVHFQSHVDGSRLFLGPESAMEIQAVLGSDIAMLFDECPPQGCGREYAEKSLALTQRWAVRCRTWIDRHTPACDNGRPQRHFGIVQGSVFRDLRVQAARDLMPLDFDGYAIGGVSVGESEPEMLDAVRWAIAELPSAKPRYVMGVGTPPQLLEMIGLGVDMFDCVLPTRVARNGAAFTTRGLISLRNKPFERDHREIDPEGGTASACAGFPRGYIRHLVKAGEILGLRLLTLHNLHFYIALMRDARSHIEAGTFRHFKQDFIARYQSNRLTTTTISLPPAP
ncbi:MAG: tRNA guanosine(34) transglycosylase Tgt [Verrucomicrobiales bacterium]